MATLEHEQLVGSHEHQVFVSAHRRRQRVLRATGLVAGALALVWLVALGLATAGSTRLPGLSVPGAIPQAASAATATSGPSHSDVRARAARVAVATTRRLEPRSATAPAKPVRTTAPATSVSSATRTVPAAAGTSTATQAQTAATPSQGWARRGFTGPPGRTKRNEQTPRGAGHATAATTTGTTHGNGHGKG